MRDTRRIDVRLIRERLSVLAAETKGELVKINAKLLGKISCFAENTVTSRTF